MYEDDDHASKNTQLRVDGFAIKFHRPCVYSIVGLECSGGVPYADFTQTKLLARFRAFNPSIVRYD